MSFIVIDDVTIPNLRYATNESQEKNYLRNSLVKKSQYLIWYTFPEIGRQIHHAKIINFSYEKEGLIIKFERSDLPHIEYTQTIYAFDKTHNILMKGHFHNMNRQYFMISVNERVMLEEKRSFIRQRFFTAPVMGKILTYVAIQDKIKHHDVRIVDISEGGFAFLVPSILASEYKQKMSVKIEKVHDTTLPDGGIEGSINYIQTLENPHRYKEISQGVSYSRVGVQYSDSSELFKEVFESL